MAGGAGSRVPTYPPPSSLLPLLHMKAEISTGGTKAPECHGWFRSYISGLVPRRLMQVETERDSAEAHVTLMGGSDNNPIKGRIYCVRFSIQTTS